MARRSRPAVTALAVGAAIVYSSIAGHFTTFTRPAEVATFVPGLLGLIVAVRVSSGSSVRPDRRQLGWSAWWLVVVAINAIEVVALLLGANHAHPTLSDLVNPWLRSTSARAVAFTLWLGFGYWLTRR